MEKSMENCESSITNGLTDAENIKKIRCHEPALFDLEEGDDCPFEITGKYILLGLVLPVLFYMIDFVFDILLAYNYFVGNKMVYFWLTVSFVAFPAFISTFYSIIMYRYSEAILCALKTKIKFDPTSEEYKKRAKWLSMEDSNLSHLNIVESFLEDAPQLVVRTTSLLCALLDGNRILLQTYEFRAIIISFGSISWSLASRHRAERFYRIDKRHLDWFGSIFLGLASSFITCSRILAISQAASTCPCMTSVACVAHWLLMTAWILRSERAWFVSRPTIRKIDFWYQCILGASFGLVYTFVFLPLENGQKRRKYCFYYILCFLENISALILWNTWAEAGIKESSWFFPILIFTFCSYLLGIVITIIYYWYFHPVLGIRGKLNRKEHDSRIETPEILRNELKETVKLSRKSQTTQEQS